ncbi:MAG: DUF2442 domain-containing protein [Polyangiales bacterium]
MAANVAVLATNERTRDFLGAIRPKVLISHSFGSGKTYSLLVGHLADLDRPRGRRELEDLCNTVKGDVPVVLVSQRNAPRSDAAFQTLAHVAWLAGREVYIAPNAEAVSRMVFARQVEAEAKLIASASMEDGQLIVWSCEPRRYAVAASEIPALATMSAAVLAKFEVSESGSRIHWGDGDVDLNLDAIRAYADPEVRRQQEAEYRKYAARYAAAIRKLREERELRQTDIDGLSERQVRRLEEGETMPHSSTLKKLALAHGMSIQDYLRELGKRSSSRAGGTRARKTRRARPLTAKRS